MIMIEIIKQMSMCPAHCAISLALLGLFLKNAICHIAHGSKLLTSDAWVRIPAPSFGP